MKRQSARTLDRIATVTAQEFAQVVLGAHGPIAVEFMSYSCAYCQALEPVLQQVAEQVGAQEKIVRVNIAVDPELAASYRIQATPTLMMFLNGSPIGRAEGPHPEFDSLLDTVTAPFQT
jgi:thioredoxin-like negative regulator of GroEL